MGLIRLSTSMSYYHQSNWLWRSLGNKFKELSCSTASIKGNKLTHSTSTFQNLFTPSPIPFLPSLTAVLHLPAFFKPTALISGLPMYNTNCLTSKYKIKKKTKKEAGVQEPELCCRAIQPFHFWILTCAVTPALNVQALREVKRQARRTAAATPGQIL